MKKIHSRRNKPTAKSLAGDALHPEYEFDYVKARPNRFAAKMTPETRAIVLDPDGARVFDSSKSVNAVLRALIETMPRAGG
jgi:hypothetical protein